MTVDNLIDQLKSREFTDKELRQVYNHFMFQNKVEGFNRGCDYMRSVYGKQRMSRLDCLEGRFKKFLDALDDLINEDEQSN